MFSKKLSIVAAALALAVAAPSQGASEFIIENFESYSGGVGSWTAESDGINISLDLAETGAIQGNKDLVQTIGANLVAGAYVVKNLDMNLALPVAATNFQFKLKPLLSVSVGRTVVVTLRDQDNVNHVSPTTALSGLAAGQISDISIPLSSFTPAADAGAISNLTGVTLRFASTISVSADEHLDSIRVTWDNSSVDNWTLY